MKKMRWTGLALAALMMVSASCGVTAQAAGQYHQDAAASAEPEHQSAPLMKALGYDGQVRLSWEPAEGTVGYTLRQDQMEIAQLPADATAYVSDGLENGTVYTFQLTARTADGAVAYDEVRCVPNSAGPENSRPGGQGAGDGSGATAHPLAVQKTNAEGELVSPELSEIWLWFTHNISRSGLGEKNLELITLEGPDGLVSVDGYVIDPAIDFNHRQFAFLKLSEPLKPSSDYTIRVKKGIMANNGGETEKDQLLNFSTAAADYADMKGHWAAKAVDFVTERGLFHGTSANLFSPELPLTRGMFVTVLWRMAGSPVGNSMAAQYGDVPAGAYFKDAVSWAAQHDIVNGVGDGLFAPDAPVSREQLATILYRYQKKPESHGSVAHYADADSISGYAVPAVSWAVEQGLISGVTSTTLVPQGAATRAQSAAILMRFVLQQAEPEGVTK